MKTGKKYRMLLRKQFKNLLREIEVEMNVNGRNYKE